MCITPLTPQTEKQQRLNQLDVVITMKLDQLRCMVPRDPEEEPAGEPEILAADVGNWSATRLLTRSLAQPHSLTHSTTLTQSHSLTQSHPFNHIHSIALTQSH